MWCASPDSLPWYTFLPPPGGMPRRSLPRRSPWCWPWPGSPSGICRLTPNLCYSLIQTRAKVLSQVGAIVQSCTPSCIAATDLLPPLVRQGQGGRAVQGRRIQGILQGGVKGRDEEGAHIGYTMPGTPSIADRVCPHPKSTLCLYHVFPRELNSEGTGGAGASCQAPRYIPSCIPNM